MKIQVYYMRNFVKNVFKYILQRLGNIS